AMFDIGTAVTIGGRPAFGLYGYLGGLVALGVVNGVAFSRSEKNGRRRGVGLGLVTTVGSIALASLLGFGVFQTSYHPPGPALEPDLMLGLPEAFMPGVGDRDSVRQWMGDDMVEWHEDTDINWG